MTEISSDTGVVERETIVVEHWVYCGRTLTGPESKRTLAYLWRDKDGKERVFAKLKGVVVGGTYAINARRDGDRVLVVGTSTWLVDEEKAFDSFSLEVSNRAAILYKNKVDAETRMAKNSQLSELLGPIKEAAKSFRTYEDLDAFIYVVSRAIRDSWNRPQ